MASNIELKARCADLAAARRTALALGARPAGVLEQTDTFFRAPGGRLKLRETNDAPAQLIPYARPDEPGAKQSEYVVLPVEQPDAARRLLTRILGAAGVVRKRRELLLLDNVRIHLDDVEGLGTFIEFEAVLGPGRTPESERRRLADLADAFGVRPQDVESRAYVDLLADAAPPPRETR